MTYGEIKVIIWLIVIGICLLAVIMNLLNRYYKPSSSKTKSKPSAKSENVEEENQVPIIPCTKNKSHQWIIEASKGPTSIGKCDICGAIQKFNNPGYDLNLLQSYSSIPILLPGSGSSVLRKKIGGKRKRHTGYSEQEEMEIISQQKKFQNELESDSEYQKAKDLDAAVTPPTDAVEYLNWLKTKRTDQPNFENKFKEKYLPEALKEYRLEKLQIEQRFEKGNTKPTTEPFPQITPYRCYECEKLMAVVEGKHRQFLGCTGFPDCKYRMRLSQDGKSAIPFKTNYDKTSGYDKTSDYNCDKCNKPMVIKDSKRGKFLGCSGFPKCRNIRKW